MTEREKITHDINLLNDALTSLGRMYTLSFLNQAAIENVLYDAIFDMKDRRKDLSHD